jgi:hypothetical protein
VLSARNCPMSKDRLKGERLVRIALSKGKIGIETNGQAINGGSNF